MKKRNSSAVSDKYVLKEGVQNFRDEGKEESERDKGGMRRECVIHAPEQGVLALSLNATKQRHIHTHT